MKNLLKAIAATAFVVVPMQSIAATGDIPFNGTVNATCIVNVGANGVMTTSADLQTFGSNQAGGSAGTASVVANGGTFNMSVDPVTSFDTEPAADATSSETFTPSYASTGATSAAPGTTGSTAVGAGTSNVTVDLVAVKGGTDVFAAGNYTATVTLRCE
ncbi:MAG: hypothetical protein AAF423_08460 [Pseudomonadota bacterium]